MRKQGARVRVSPEHRQSRRSGAGLGLALLGALALAAAPGCGDDAPPPPDYDRGAAWTALGITETEAGFDERTAALDEVPIDPKPVVGEGYDPSFPEPIAFDPDGLYEGHAWETGEAPRSVADPRAKKGGSVTFAMSEWVPTLRTNGPASALVTTSWMHSLVYETLLQYDATEHRYYPGLATHWQFMPDRKTFRFRLNPHARWADGTEVTADDVKATFEHMMNPDRRDPNMVQLYSGRIERVRVLDKLTVEIVAKEPRWRNVYLIAATTLVFPASHIRMDGATYIKDWNWKLPPGTGPYEILPDGVKKARSITLTRRTDYWDENNPDKRGMFNFDEIEFSVVREEELMYQKLLKGEIDFYRVSRAQRWVDELDQEPEIRNGWVQKRKIYNLTPQGFSGYILNMRTPPFDSLNVRKAFAHLLNREKMFAKFFFYQYDYEKSYFPYSDYERPGAERVRFDAVEARRLLALDGWTHRNEQNLLVNDKGERFPKLKLEYFSPGFTRIHSVFQDDLRREAGIELELAMADYTTLSKKVWDHKFQIYFMGWSGTLFPLPESLWHSKYVDEAQSRNFPGFSDPEADRLMDAYEEEWDPQKRIEQLQRLDEIVFEAHPYLLGWGAPYVRYIYQDKFGHPPEYFDRTTRADLNVMVYWWYDEERAARTADSRAQGRPNHPDRPLNQYDDVDQKYWLTHREPMPDAPAETPGG